VVAPVTFSSESSFIAMAEAIRRELQQWTVRSKWAEARTDVERTTISVVRHDNIAVQSDESDVFVDFVASTHALPFTIRVSKCYPMAPAPV